MKPLFLYFLAALTVPAATPAAAQEVMSCQFMTACTLGEPCAPSQELFRVTWEGDAMGISLGGKEYRPTMDFDTNTGSWRDGWTLYQLFMPGDGAVILTRIPDLGGRFEAIEVLEGHCSPA